jgi:transcription antitermination factor NusG
MRAVQMMRNSKMADMSAARITGQTPWWALYARHQHEKQVAETLQAKGFDVFLPLYESVRRWKDRRKVLALPLFPGYVFVRGGHERRLGILTTPGVHMIISRGEAAADIPEEEIQAIRRTLDAKFAVEPHPYLNCGDRVRVTRGALEGIEGILLRKKNMFRLVLSVDMLAQSVSIEIDATDVEPVSSAAKVSGSPARERARADWASFTVRPESAFRAG